METIPGTRTGIIKSRQCIVDEVFELTMRQQFSGDNGHVETRRVVEMCIVAIPITIKIGCCKKVIIIDKVMEYAIVWMN